MNSLDTTQFTNLLLSVNAAAAPAGYPNTWTQYNAVVSGLAGSTTGRFAFRYLVTDTSVNGDYIGIDSVTVESAIPEPASAGMVAGALMASLAALRRSKKGVTHA